MTHFKVNIKPVTQGSVTAIPVNGRARIIHTHPKALYEERALIQSLFKENGGEKIDGAVEMTLTFAFIRPKSVSEKKRPYPIVKPDTDKLIRAVLDSLTHHAYDDDCQVVKINAKKIYDDEEYIEIDVRRYVKLNEYI